MITLKLPKNTVVQGGQFFNQVTEAANRGCKLVWNGDYTFATQVLDTAEFFDSIFALQIVEAGGDVFNCPYETLMSWEDYNTKEVPEDILNYIGQYPNEQINGGEVAPSTSIYYKDLFLFYTPIYPEPTEVEVNAEVPEDKTTQPPVAVKVLNSVNGELLPISITKLI